MMMPGEYKFQVASRFNDVSISDLLARSPPSERQTEVYLNVHLNVHLIGSESSSIRELLEADKWSICRPKLIRFRGGRCHEEAGGADAGLGGADE